MHFTTKNLSLIPALTIGILFTVSCAIPDIYPRNVESGTIETPNVIIEKKDGKTPFRLASGIAFTPPFQSTALWNQTTYIPTVINDWKNILEKMGAKKVDVYLNGEKKYGILSLCKVDERHTSPGSRSYLIQIPGNTWAEAKKGNISVVYETIGTNPASPGYTDFGWVLWLSDVPFNAKEKGE
jgi:hypothetical protein